MKARRVGIGRWAWKVGAVVSVLLGGLWVASGWADWRCDRFSRSVARGATVSGGVLTVFEFTMVLPPVGWSWQFGWHAAPRWALWPERSGDTRIWKVPMWMPLVLAAAPTIWLWRRDRRRWLGGGEACPECGRARA